MATTAQEVTGSKNLVRAGLIVSAIPSLFLLMDGVMKLFKPAFVVEATTQLGFPEGVIVGLGVVVLACLALYVIPQTAVLGAILLTGYLGGAVAAHLRHDGEAFTVLFPVLFGAFLWAGLLLRDARLRALLPLRG